MEPWSFTLRELSIMARAKQRKAWDMQADLMALLANCHASKPDGGAWANSDFNPLAEKPKPRKADVSVLKIFLPDGDPRKTMSDAKILSEASS